MVLHQFSSGFSTQARFWTGCHCPIAVLNGFTVLILAAMTKLINNSATVEKTAVFTNKHTTDIATH